MAHTTTTGPQATVNAVLNAGELRELQALVRRVPVPRSLVSYVVRLVRSTRPDDPDASPLIRQFVSWGAGPRASQYLTLGAKARAAMDGRGVPDYEDVRAIAPAVLRHRVVTNFHAEAEGRTPADLVDELLESSRRWT